MIHSNFTITRSFQCRTAEIVERSFAVSDGQIFFGEVSLTWLYPGHVGVGIERDAVGSQSQDGINCLLDAVDSGWAC